jgi:hypothetical protein
MTHKEQIDRTRERIRDCKLIGEDAKEGLQSLLDDAFPADGAVDSNELLSTLCNQWVLHVLNSYAVIQNEVRTHAVTCRSAIPDGKLGMVVRFQWPVTAVLCVAIVSGKLPMLLDFFKAVVMR